MPRKYNFLRWVPSFMNMKAYTAVLFSLRLEVVISRWQIESLSLILESDVSSSITGRSIVFACCLNRSRYSILLRENHDTVKSYTEGMKDRRRFLLSSARLENV